MPLNIFPVTLVESYMISPKVKHFVFRADLSPAFQYLPGQFITIHFERDGKPLKRSYSIANPPEENNRIEFAAGYVEGGPGTDLLFNLKPGDTINISGPFGRLILKDEIPGRYLLIATSTGVTPYRAMLTELKARLMSNPSLKVVIMLGVQTADEILYAQAFNELVEACPQQVSFRAHLSRTGPSDLASGQFSGYVQHAFPDLALNAEQDVVYLCGNPGMIDAAFEALKESGFTSQQIVREKYISAR
ncbi:ferredoxin--NADP reductase [Legionella sp. CNM-4043-24]|uniref:ferredoxin--NADP reductase n=1 Tax=Legionella sp. CNM-4043-24 TaxID=3421646 RepID=UPI00403AF219